jgi:hypothetical protein
VGRRAPFPGSRAEIAIVVGSERAWGALPGVPVASDTSIDAAFEPVKLFECLRKGGCDIGSRLAVQHVCLDEPGTSGRIPEGALEVPNSLGVVVGALPAGGIGSCNRQPSKSNVVHDHIRFRQHEISAIACIGVRICTRHV